MVRQYSSDRVKPRYRLNIKRMDVEAVEQIKDQLENVPDVIQKICNDFGWTVVIFDGKMTDNASMRHLKGKKLGKAQKGLTYDDLAGASSPEEKEILISQNYLASERIHPDSLAGGLKIGWWPSYTPLHEYGHMVDDIVERSKLLQRLFVSIISRVTTRMGRRICEMSEYEADPKEFFSESFAKYYFSDESRKKLKKSCPNAYEFLSELEKELVEKYN